MYEDTELMESASMNPYSVAPAQPSAISMNDMSRHDAGNVAAANSEARAIANVKAQVIMAKQFPRDPMQAAEKILSECMRPSLADAATYTFPRGKETVSGPSIRLAEVLARNWGNMTFGYEVLERKTPRNGGVGFSMIRAYAWDFETNLVIDRQFELKHWRTTKSGGYALTDDRDIYELEANMASRRIRACILQMIPGDVTAAAVNACRKTASNGIIEIMNDAKKRSDLIGKMIRIFGKMGVTQEDLEDCLNTKSADWTADHMLKLKEIKNSLDDGAASLGDYFPRLGVENQNDVISKDQVKQLMEAAKATGMQGAISKRLKEMKIAKFADVPSGMFDEVMAMVQSFGEPADAAPEIPAEPTDLLGEPVNSEGKEV